MARPAASSRLLGRRGAGFSLIELLVVMAIMAGLMSLIVYGMRGMTDSHNLHAATYQISGMLEQARTYAMAKGTYVWVGFFEEDPTQPDGTAGVGRVVMVAVASRDGTKIYAENDANPAPLAGDRLIQIAKVMKVEKTHLDSLSATDITTRATVPAKAYQVGDALFATRVGPPATANGTTFPYPLSGTVQYSFSKIVQFSPLGDAAKIVDTPVPLMEIGLRPARANVADAVTRNLAAIQVEGIGGQARIYAP